MRLGAVFTRQHFGGLAAATPPAAKPPGTAHHPAPSKVRVGEAEDGLTHVLTVIVLRHLHDEDLQLRLNGLLRTGFADC